MRPELAPYDYAIAILGFVGVASGVLRFSCALIGPLALLGVFLILNAASMCRTLRVWR